MPKASLKQAPNVPAAVPRRTYHLPADIKSIAPFGEIVVGRHIRAECNRQHPKQSKGGK